MGAVNYLSVKDSEMIERLKLSHIILQLGIRCTCTCDDYCIFWPFWTGSRLEIYGHRAMASESWSENKITYL